MENNITIKMFKAVAPYRATVVLWDAVESTVYNDAHDIPPMYDDDVVFCIESDKNVLNVTIYHGFNCD